MDIGLRKHVLKKEPGSTAVVFAIVKRLVGNKILCVRNRGVLKFHSKSSSGQSLALFPNPHGLFFKSGYILGIFQQNKLGWKRQADWCLTAFYPGEPVS